MIILVMKTCNISFNLAIACFLLRTARTDGCRNIIFGFLVSRLNRDLGLLAWASSSAANEGAKRKTIESVGTIYFHNQHEDLFRSGWKGKCHHTVRHSCRRWRWGWWMLGCFIAWCSSIIPSSVLPLLLIGTTVGRLVLAEPHPLSPPAPSAYGTD